MSDTSTDYGMDRQFTGDFTPGDGETELTFDQVRDLLWQLVKDDPTAKMEKRNRAKSADQLVTNLAAILWRSGDQFHYESAIRALDRRQLYAQVMAPDAGASVYVMGYEFEPDERRLAAEWFMNASEDADAAAEAVAEMQVQAGLLTEEQRGEFVAGMLALPDDRRQLQESPESRLARETQTTGTLAADALAAEDSPDAFTQMFRDMLGAPQQQGRAPAFLTDGDVRGLFRSMGDNAAFNTYNDQLARYRALDEVPDEFADPFRINMDPQQSDPAVQRQALQALYRGDTGQENIDRLSGAKSYTLSQARDLLYGKNPDEIRALQEKLKRAGYFQTNGEQGDEPLFWGDPSDSRTQSAWRNLIGDAVREGVPVYDMLDRRIQSALDSGLFDEDGNPISERGDVRLTDRARIRVNAKEMAQDTLGRNLTPDEHNRLVEFIHQMETDTQNAASDAGNTDGSQVVEDTDVNAQIEEYLRRENPVEAGGRDVALSYNDFAGLLAGPGRGGSF